MPMEVLYSQPYLISESETPTGFPQTIDVVIGGHSYVVNTSFEPYRRDAFRHRSIQAQRESIDLNNIPGEGTVNTEGLWRRDARDWHFGAGQPYQDRKGSEDGRFSTSKGVNPWMQWQVELLNDTYRIWPIAGNAQVMQVGPWLYIMDFTSNICYVMSETQELTVLSSFPAQITRMATDGYNVWWASEGNLGIYNQNPPGYVGGGAITQLVTSGDFDGVWFVAERLMATSGPNLFNIISTTPAAPPTPLWTHPNAAFTFTAMAAGSGNIYYGGNVGGDAPSSIYQNTIEATGTALTIPVQALPLEGSEVCTSLYGYLNFIFVGTNLGVRMCRTLSQYDPTGNQGDLEAGPLIPGLFPPGPVGYPVQSMVGNNRFMYFGWSNYDEISTGIGRCDLSTFIDTQAPAFTSDLMVTGQGNVTSMDWNPVNNAPVFVVEGMGVYTDSGVPVPEGYVDSGAIGYGISDDKILWAGDIGTVLPQQGTVAMAVSVDGAPQSLVGVQTGTANQSPFPIGQIRGELTTVRINLLPDPVTNESPILHRWLLKALPAITAGTTISAVILLYQTISSRGGDVYYDSYAEYQYLYSLRTTQTVVQYQEGPFSAMCVIDELDWLPFKEHDASTEGGFVGDLIVYLKTVDIGA